MAEGTASSAAGQLRNYGVGLILGLAAVGYIQAATTLMGPFMVIYFGMGLVALPEAARVLRRSPHRLPLFCMLLSGGLAIMALAWGVFLLVALPRGLGDLVLGNIWKPTYPLVLPTTIGIFGSCLGTGAGTGLHALGAARRSLRVMLIGTAVIGVLSIAGAAVGGPTWAMVGYAAGSWTGVFITWRQLRVAMREYGGKPGGTAS
jgi:O-antigen/teichoic acid export membrane protein